MISCPATIAVPLLGGTSVVSMRMRVLLPAPFGPRRPKISPFCTVKLTLSTACNLPKRLLIPPTSMANSSWLRSSMAVYFLAVFTGGGWRKRRHR